MNKIKSLLLTIIFFLIGQCAYSLDIGLQLPSSEQPLISISTESPMKLYDLITYQQSNGIQSIAWSPDESYFITGAYYAPSHELSLFNFDGKTITLIDQQQLGRAVHAVDWHPSQAYIAIGTQSSKAEELLLYKFESSTKTLIPKQAQKSPGGSIYSLAWHPSGNYLFVGSTATSQLQIYSFDRDREILTLIEEEYLTSAPYLNTIQFSPDGEYVIIGTHEKIVIYHFDGTGLTLKKMLPTELVSSVHWSPTNDLIGISTLSTANSLQLFHYDRIANTLVQQSHKIPDEKGNFFSLRWHPLQNNLIIGNYQGEPSIKMYTINQNSGLAELLQTYTLSSYILCMRWSPSGSYLAGITLDRSIIIYTVIEPITLLDTIGNILTPFKNKTYHKNAQASIKGDSL